MPEGPQQWYWQYKLGLVKRSQTGGALWFGTGIHLALEKWYVPGRKRGVEPQETWKEFVGERIEYMKAQVVSGELAAVGNEWVDALELGDKILANYRKVYGDDEEWEVISPEQTAQILIPKRGTKDPIVKYVMTFDAVMRNLETGRIWLWDHKTAASIQTSHLPLDDQAGSYYALAKPTLVPQGLMKPGENLKGILYNFLMKSPPDERPENADGYKLNSPAKKHYVEALIAHYTSMELEGSDVTDPKYWGKKTIADLEVVANQNRIVVEGEVSKTQPPPRFHREPVPRTRSEQKKQVERIADEAEIMQAVSRGDLPIIKNPTKECSFCQFRDMCELDEKGGDVEEYMDEVFVVQDPYAAHR